MKRGLYAFLILMISLQAKAINWQNLWSTPDQQAQALMEKGQVAKAKELFEDKSWAATAAYRAGDYELSAEMFKDRGTEHDYYNQGNALAHLGQYKEAIQAYNNALAMNPKDEDALFNRKLVKNLLKKDKDKQQNKDQQDKNQQDRNQQDKNQQDKKQQDKKQQDKNQQDKNQQDKKQQDKNQQAKNQQDKKQQDKNQQARNQKNKQDQQKDAKKAKQEAHVPSEKDREKQQAKQQWLQLIPDDPGGLMREKFLRDHLRRERGWYQ